MCIRDRLESVRAAIAATQRYGSTFNQSGSGITEEFVTELGHRGITFWPWTYNTQQTFLDQYFWGINGFTTDYSMWVRNTAKSVKFQSDIDSKMCIRDRNRPAQRWSRTGRRRGRSPPRRWPSAF